MFCEPGNLAVDEIKCNVKPITIVKEITVIIKDDEKSLRAKYLVYEEFTVSLDDFQIKKCISETLKSFEGEPTDVKIKINFSL